MDLSEKTTTSCTKVANDVSTCVKQNACTDEAKECPDGSFVFREQPNCDFAACPSLRTSGKASNSAPLPITGKTKNEQITSQLSQKAGIPALEVIITYKNEADNKTTYDGGTYKSKKGDISGRWIATKINGTWTVTSLSTGIPLCKEIDPYFYPKDIVPACKDAKNNIIAR